MASPAAAASPQPAASPKSTASPWADGRVVRQQRWTESLFSIVVDVGPLSFEAGQFTRLALDIGGQAVARPYSFVNAPGAEYCEFYYVVVPGGPLTARLPELLPGDPIRVSRQVTGFMVLSELPDAGQLWLLATGTGIGPFLSILDTPAPWLRYRQVVLAHGVRRVAELAYAGRIAALQKRHGERLRFVPLLTRDDAGLRPGALAGRIPEVLRSGALEAAAGLRLSAAASQVMLCGNPAMVSDTTAVLRDRGLKKNRRRDPGQITVENYW